MNDLVRWLLARRVGEEEVDRFFEELDELHQRKTRDLGEVAGDRWRRKELRRALLAGLAGLVRGGTGERTGGAQPVTRTGAAGEGVRDLGRDLRFGLRTLRKRPSFALLVVGILGLGIGTTATMFSLVDGILLKDLAYERPEELVTVRKTFPAWRDNPVLGNVWDRFGLRWNEFLRLRDETRTFQGVAVHRASTATLSSQGDPVKLDAGEVSAGFFPLLGIRPLLGRTFLPGEEGPGAPRLVMLSHELWQGRFGADPAMVGRSLQLNGEPFEVIGVLPRGTRVYSTFYNAYNSAIDTGDRALWIPANWNRVDDPNGRTDFEVVGRLRSGVTGEQALDEVDTLLRAGQSPEALRFHLDTPREQVVGGHRDSLLLLLAAAGLLLLIACGNAATLLLGEALDRRAEISIRVAMGASRGRIARQFLTESLILGVAGSLAGLALTPVGIRAFLAMGPALPRLQDVAVNQTVLLVSVVTGVACAVIFGFGPTFLQHRRSIHDLLLRGGRWSTGGGGQVQAFLVTGELALTVVLLITGGLLIRSLGELGKVDPGFDARGVATVRLEIPEGYFGTDSKARLDGTRRLRREALDRIRAIPGVLRAGAVDGLPFPGRSTGSLSLQVEGTDGEEPQSVFARNQHVSPGYFAAMDIPLLAGRNFTDADGDEGADEVYIINETIARQIRAVGSPLDARIVDGADRYRIIGVVGDVREQHLAEEPSLMVYRHASFSSKDFSIVARTSGDPASLVPLMREAVRAVDPGVPVAQETTLEVLITQSEGAERFRTFLVTAFAVLATVLALVGVFGVTARNVAHRTREMGIRMALGARGRRLVRMMALSALRAGGLGILLGIVGALVITRALTTFFYGIQPWDAWTFGGTILLLGALCVAAAGMAARGVTRVEPMQVLREE